MHFVFKTKYFFIRADLVVKGSQNRVDVPTVRIMCVGRFTCSVLCTLRNAKQGPARGSGTFPQKIYALRLNLVLSEAQNCYPKDRLWDAVREISLAVPACYFKLSSYLGRIKTPP